MSEIIVVGGGIAGLTAASYLTKLGHKPLLIEKNSKCGGLISSFERDGFVYDGGIRATENSGILFPMLKDLGIDIEFARNEISLGVEDQIIRLQSIENIKEYQELLNTLYPESQDEISEIIIQMKKIAKYMDIQYGIDNPAFLDMSKNLGYIITKILPWMVKYALTVPKITKLNIPILQFLKKYTQNQALLDIITQHFFKEIPAYFALSYLKIYLDYHYPIGGTGVFPQKLATYIQENGGTIQPNTLITSINPEERYVTDSNGNKYDYTQLIWAADLNSLYNYINLDSIKDPKTKQAVKERRQELENKLGNDSILTVYLAVDKPPTYFSEKHTEHFFYTPSRQGETTAGPLPSECDRDQITEWITKLSKLQTYEISIPVLRDPNLAPPGKTGLIISILFDFHLTKRIKDQGWYEEFREHWKELVIEALDETIYSELKDSVIHSFTTTPLTIEEITHNSHGAITGWAYTNQPMPAENRLPHIFQSTRTPIPGVSQAGHWTYSPSGMPISVLTGKLAADRTYKNTHSAGSKPKLV